MYSYSSASRGTYHNHRRSRLTQLLILVLVVTIVVLIIVMSNALAFRNNFHQGSIRFMQIEIDSALTQLNNLSRTGSSNTTSVLGKIRQHVYAAQIISEQNAELNGKDMVDPNYFGSLLSTLDTFEAKKLAGQPTIEQQTSLTNILTELELITNNLT